MKKRHWLVTTCMIIVVVFSAASAFWVLIDKDSVMDKLPRRTPDSIIGFYFFLSAAQAGVTIAMLYWKKWGFWAAIGVVVGNIALELSITNEADTWKLLFNFVGIGLLYGLLQIKKDGVPAWNNLE